MIKASGACRITGLVTTDLEIKRGQNGLVITANSHLLDDDGGSHGHTKFVGPWSKEVVESLNELIENVEREVASVHFEGEDHDRRPNSESRSGQPKGLLAAKLGKTPSGVDEL